MLSSAQKIILSTLERLESRAARVKTKEKVKGPNKLVFEGKHMAFIIAISKLLVRYEDVLAIPPAPAEGQAWKNGLSIKEEHKVDIDSEGRSGLVLNPPSFLQTTYWGRWRSSNGFGNPITSREDFKQHELERKLFWISFLSQANRMWYIRERLPANSEETVGRVFVRLWSVMLQRLPAVARSILMYKPQPSAMERIVKMQLELNPLHKNSSSDVDFYTQKFSKLAPGFTSDEEEQFISWFNLEYDNVADFMAKRASLASRAARRPRAAPRAQGLYFLYRMRSLHMSSKD